MPKIYKIYYVIKRIANKIIANKFNLNKNRRNAKEKNANKVGRNKYGFPEYGNWIALLIQIWAEVMGFFSLDRDKRQNPSYRPLKGDTSKPL